MYLKVSSFELLVETIRFTQYNNYKQSIIENPFSYWGKVSKKSNPRRDSHITNTAVISIRNPGEPIHTPIRTPGVLDFPPHAGLISNQDYSVIHIVVAVVEDPARVKLKSVARNADWYWAIIKLIHKSLAVSLFYVPERGNFETPSFFFAFVWGAWYCWSVWVVGVTFNAFNLHIRIRALQKTSITPIS